MIKLFSKLRSKCGESLVESVCSILVFTFSSIILLSMIATATKINTAVKTENAAIAAELEAAEMQISAKSSGKIILTCEGKSSVEIAVDFYSADNSGTLYSFKVD